MEVTWNVAVGEESCQIMAILVPVEKDIEKDIYAFYIWVP